jgi:hypothetical protein
MGMLKNMFSQLESELDNALSSSQTGKAQRRASGPPPTRWEKAVIGLDKIVAQVVKVDPDGVDIVCFGGNEDADWYRNVKNTKKLEEMVNDKRPSGPCTMGAAMGEALKDAFDKDLTTRPVSILVLTACMPTDADDLVTELMKTVTRIADTCDTCPLSVTFVQIGSDQRVEKLFQKLDGRIQATCAANGETFDLVDTIKDEEIQAAMAEVKGTKSSGKNGALIGAFVGAAAGVGGMYIYNKQQAKQRTKGWGGKWQVTYEGEEISILNVTDDEAGNLNIEGFPSGEPTTGTYSMPSEEEHEDEDYEYTITFKDPSGEYEIEGTIEDEHAITWSDGTRWDEMQQDGAHWSKYAAAAAGGAAVTGATGYLLDKKFFNKASKADQCDYIILMDRSEGMTVVDR